MRRPRAGACGPRCRFSSKHRGPIRPSRTRERSVSARPAALASRLAGRPWSRTPSSDWDASVVLGQLTCDRVRVCRLVSLQEVGSVFEHDCRQARALGAEGTSWSPTPRVVPWVMGGIIRWIARWVVPRAARRAICRAAIRVMGWIAVQVIRPTMGRTIRPTAGRVVP
jgi:hypothetical protein